MKDFLDKFGLTESLAHICPGAIALASLVLWIDPAFLSKISGKASGNSVIATALLLIAAYGTGLALSFLSVVGEEKYNSTPLPEFARIYRWREMMHFPPWFWLWINHGFPKLPSTAPANLELMQARLDVRDALDSFPTRNLYSLIQYGSDQLLLLRTLFPDRYKDRAVTILSQAEIVHRRILFALGVSQSLLVWTTLASMRLAGYAAVRWAVWLPIHPDQAFWVGATTGVVSIYLHFLHAPLRRVATTLSAVALFFAICLFSRNFFLKLPYGFDWPVFFTFGALALLGSFRLRAVANRWRRHELILTHSLISWSW